MPCSQDECSDDARWIPVLVLRPKASDCKAMLAEFLHLAYCDEHRATCTVDTFLSDEGATKMTKHIREAGLEAPDRRDITLTWKVVDADGAERLAKKQDCTRSDESLAF